MPTRSFVARLRLIGAALGAIWIWALPVSAQVVSEDYKMLAPDVGFFNYFGRSIAIGDGVIAIGADRAVNNGLRTGSAYLYELSTGSYITTLIPTDPVQAGHFGWSIAIDNNLVAVGAYDNRVNSVHSGAAYLFDVSSGVQVAKLAPSDPGLDDLFGFSIDIDNGIVAVGARDDRVDGVGSGSAYVFDAATGIQLAKLVPEDGMWYDDFGVSIAIDNGIVAVGASDDDDRGNGSGAAYLFDALTGEQLTKVVPKDGRLGDHFGSSIAIDNGILAVGAPWVDGFGTGSVYLFDASTHEQLTKLSLNEGPSGLRFGSSIALEDDILAVGDLFSDSHGVKHGAAYIFRASTGEQLASLVPTDGAFDDRFGNSIALGDGMVGVGASSNDDMFDDSGSAYVFTVPTFECTADTNSDGMLTPDDFTAWVNAFNNQLPECDQNGDGLCTPTDFTAWIANYNAGC